MCQLIWKGLKWIKHIFTGKYEEKVMNHSDTFSIVNLFFWKLVQKSKEKTNPKSLKLDNNLSVTQIV